MMDEIKSGDVVESKAITIEQPEQGFQFPMMLTAFDYNDNETLKRSGFRGRYVIFNLIEGDVQESFFDPEQATFSLLDDDVKEAMRRIVRGWETYAKDGVDWTELEHGGVYTVDEIIGLC